MSNCSYCNRPFNRSNSNQKYCSKPCSNSAAGSARLANASDKSCRKDALRKYLDGENVYGLYVQNQFLNNGLGGIDVEWFVNESDRDAKVVGLKNSGWKVSPIECSDQELLQEIDSYNQSRSS